jgi:SAM-dependent methyltransferase
MNEVFYERTNCRLCKSEKLEVVLEIGKTAVSDKYSFNKDDPKDLLVPLDVYMCVDCGHVQIIHVIKPEYLWADYHFKTSLNKKLTNHYEDYVKDVISFSTHITNKFHLDIGSNDGTLMKLFQDQGFRSLGVDPATEIAKEANQEGFETIVDFMNKDISEKILKEYGKIDIITANNVYAHIDDMDDLTISIKNLLDKNGLFVFEVSYLDDILDKKLLGTIFHEHLSYHSLKPLINFFDKFDLEIVKVDKNDLQGGSIVCYVQHKYGPYKIQDNFFSTLLHEEKKQLNNIDTLKKFNKNLSNLKNEINKIIDNLISEGKIIAGFGSAISATTFISFFNLGNKITFIVDDNEKKHFKFTPQFRIQVFPSKEIYNRDVDCMIIFAWEHNEKIIDKNQDFLKKGSFLTIFPDIKLITKNL